MDEIVRKEHFQKPETSLKHVVLQNSQLSKKQNPTFSSFSSPLRDKRVHTKSPNLTRDVGTPIRATDSHVASELFQTEKRLPLPLGFTTWSFSFPHKWFQAR